MANGSSWIALSGLRDNLKSYIKSNASTFNLTDIDTTVECVSYTTSQIERQLDKRRSNVFHIGIYETTPDSLLSVSGGNVIDYNQSYELSLYYLITKSGEYDQNAERILMNMKDLVLTWSNQLGISSATSSVLVRWQFLGSNEPIREEKYCYTNMQFVAYKNEI